MKILAAGDVHGDSTLTKRLAAKAKKEKVDLIILAGDLTPWGVEVRDIIAPFTKVGKEVLILPGNHETIATTDFLAELYPLTKNIHGYSAKFKDIGVFGCGGADFGLTTLNEKQFFETLSKAHKGIKDLSKKIMVTHMHPFKSKAEFSGFEGSKGIRKAIKEFKPDILLSGHIHEAEGIEEKIGKTKVINIGRKGKIIEI